MPWYTCKVHRAGPTEGGHIPILLQDTADPPAFPARWFTAVPEVKREMLSVALTAMSTGLKVDAEIPDITEFKNVNRLYLVLH